MVQDRQNRAKITWLGLCVCLIAKEGGVAAWWEHVINLKDSTATEDKAIKMIRSARSQLEITDYLCLRVWM